MEKWTYKIFDSITGQLLSSEGEFDTEVLAETAALDEAKAEGFKHFYVSSVQSSGAERTEV